MLLKAYDNNLPEGGTDLLYIQELLGTRIPKPQNYIPMYQPRTYKIFSRHLIRCKNITTLRNILYQKLYIYAQIW